jgi:hypothetical protein
MAIAAGVLMLFTLVLRYLLIERTNVNWDEFNFLRSTYVTAAGEQTRSLQTAHGHLFSWLVHSPGHELDQILVARYVIFLLAAIGAGALAWLGKRLIGGGAGLFAAFLYGSFAYVLQHGTAFRYDTLIVPCYLGAAALLVAERRPRLTAAAAGLLGALALMISIKSAFLIVPLAMVAALPLLETSGRRRALERFIVFAVSGVVFSAVFFALHVLTLTEAGGAAEATLSKATDRLINLDKPFPKTSYLIASLRWETFRWVLLLAGLVILGGELLHRRETTERIRRLQVLSLALPLATLYFYRNTYAYYYVTILPGGCLVAGYVWRLIENVRARPILVAVLAFMTAFPVVRSTWRWYTHNNHDETVVQRDIIEAVHEIFPEPVGYIDRCGMIASFSKVGPFMSTWGMGDYRRRGADIMAQLLRERQPKFVLANSPALDLSRPLRQVPAGYRWRAGDLQLLQESFVHHWGPIWVAGKALEAKSAEPLSFELLIAGLYTVEANGPVEIDGALRQPGDVIELAQGRHTFRAPNESARRVILRWGASLRRPERRPVRGPIFAGFSIGRPPP